MKTVTIDNKVIYLNQIHFIRKESKTELVISFGTDFVRIKGTSEKIESVLKMLTEGNNEEFSSNDRR